MTDMADKIAAVKAAHATDVAGPNGNFEIDPPKPNVLTMPKTALAAVAAMAMIAAEPAPSKHRLGMSKTHCYSAKQWAAMKKRRKAAQAARRRNRR